MSSPCEKMQDRIVDMLLGLLGQTESQALQDHIDGCDRCRQYYYSMQDQQDRLASLGESLDKHINAQQENVVSALHRLADPKIVGRQSAWKRLYYSQPARLAAAVLIAATIVIIAMTIAPKPSAKPVAHEQPTPTIHRQDTPPEVTRNDSQQDDLPALLDRARRMYRVGDVAGLIGLLSSETSEVSIAAADYLAQIGDATAITPLLHATQQWQDDDGENPYITAIKSIFDKIRPQQEQQNQEDSQITDLTDTSAIDPNTATADTKPEPEPELKPELKLEPELKPVTNVHITFSGMVLDKDGNPTAGAEVKVRDGANAAWTRKLKTVTDEDGYFVLKTPPGQNYTGAALLWATIPDESDFVAWTIIASEPQDVRQKHASPIPGYPGREIDTGSEARLIEEIVLMMEPAGRITGYVTDDNGNPIPTAQIEARFIFTDDAGNSIHRYSNLPWLSTAMTDETGFYIVGQLPRFWKDRRYEINRVTAPGYSQSSAGFTTIGPLDTKKLDFVLLPTGVTVTGTLTDNYGLPLPYRYIVAQVDGYAVRNCRTTTDMAGRFRIEDCPIGYDVTIVADLGQTSVHADGQSREVDFYPTAQTQIEFIEGLDEYDVQIVAEKPEFVIEIETVDSTGRALPFFPVDVRAARGHSAYPPGRPLSSRTDENGYCIITNVPNVPGLKLVFNTLAGVPNDFLSSEQADQIRQKYKNYEPREVPVEVLPGQKEYFIRAIINNQ